METQHLHIKNMMCSRCEIVVKQTLNELGVQLLFLEMGHAEIEKINSKKLDKIESKFIDLGFELLYDRNKKCIEQVKLLCIEYLGNIENQLVITKLSDYLSVNIGKNYSYLSKLFSAEEGMTIESYYISKKIERVKQLLGYGENSLSEIAVMLNYSSVHYLSFQFKKIEGCTVSNYMESKKIG